MTQDQIKDYRKTLEKDFDIRDSEIETTLSYITIGALGFFMTINDSILKLNTAHCKIILVLSLIFLFIAFLFILIRKSRTIKIDLNLMVYVDNLEADSISDDSILLEKWDNAHIQLRQLRSITYICLGTGIGLQVLFVIINV